MKTYILVLTLLGVLFSPLFAINDMSVIAEFQGEHHRSGYGFTIESLDFNHDGYEDLIVSSRFYGYVEGESGSRGKVYVYYGGPDFNSDTSPSVTLEGTNTMIIYDIFNVGDINGDGYEDLCIYDGPIFPSSFPPPNENPRLRFYYGGNDSLDNPDHVIAFPYNALIQSVSNIGDFDGDSFSDVGLHYILRQPYIKKFTIMWGGELVEQVVQEYAYNNAISSISSIGDVNGDGYRDFALGFTDPDPYTGYHMIRIYHGNPERDLSDPDVLIQTQEPITKHSRPIGDVNGDGYDDFMGYYSNVGTHAWLGGLSIDYSTPSFNFIPGWSGDESSRCLKYGDLNGDGFDDVIGTNYHERKFSVWMGSEQMNGTSDLIISRANFHNFGYSIATGDFNADGFCDVAISAPMREPNSSYTYFPGYLWIYGGNGQLQDTTVANDDPQIPGMADQLHISINPNPVRSSDGVALITARNKVPLPVNEGIVSVFNIRGQFVYSAKVPVIQSNMEHHIALKQFPTGIYLCRVSFGKISGTKKISVVK